ILPLLLTLVFAVSLRLALPSIVPVDPPTIPLKLSEYPLYSVLGILISVAISSAVVEEVAFRGYLQKPLEDAYGIVPAIVLTGLAFWYAHSDKETIPLMPFQFSVSIFLGLAAWLTRSLWPAILGHALGDLALQPAYAFHQPSFAWTLLSAKP